MSPLIVEGNTLGQKHRNYNNIVNEAIKNNPNQPVDAIDYEEPDLDNLFKIDIASNNKNVEYILEVLKSPDMLYVSRAIKQSTWLITDKKYAHIINPEYLHEHLYPEMSFKAFNKLILHVRLNLVHEERVEEFFNYYKEIDLQRALKWLPHCSISFTENIIQKHAADIPKQLLKRLCEKSITFLEIFCRSYKSYYKREMLLSTMYLLNKNFEKYLDVIESTDMGDIPGFGPKYTKIIMEKNHDRVMNNLEKYVDFLDVSTFAKYLKKEEVKDFILTQIKNKKMRSWFAYDKIKYFVNLLPIEERFDFIKRVFIEKEYEGIILEDETLDDVVAWCSPRQLGNTSSSKNIYSWYIYAPFNRAFVDLKLLIRNESNPTERLSILRVMLTCAGKDKKNIYTLLKYYREHHINEPFKFKIQFVNYLLTKTDTYKYDKETWGYLNDIFNSLEVYKMTDKSVQPCVKSIILYNIIHGESIPDIIEKKFVFETFKGEHKFSQEEREKVFNYLYKYLISKIKENIKNEKDFNDTVDIIENLLSLLNDWNKKLEDYPLILQKIKNLVIIKKENSWSRDLFTLYNIKKSWRNLLFSESIVLNPNQESCINALKHGPELLEKYRNEIITLCLNDEILFDRFLKKLRIYWCQSLADSFKLTYLENLNESNSHKALIRGLCILFSQKELLNFVQKYVPTEAKIDWSQHDDLELSLRKNIATCMYLARPQPSPAIALLYAKGDYLQYILPSLTAILHNISSSYIREHVVELLNTPVSLQKHGIRVAFSKLKHQQLKEIFSEVWKSSKNSSIRVDIFNQTYLMLCKERDKSVILEIWELLSMFIDKLNQDENKKIYLILSKTNKVPLAVRAEFWMKSYDFLKKLPVKADCSSLIDTLRSQMNDVMEFLDNEFVAKIFLEEFNKKFTTQTFNYSYQLALFLLSTKSEKAQNERYETVFVPILEKALATWDTQHETIYYTRNNLFQILDYMSEEFKNVVFHKKMVFPIAMYTNVLDKLQRRLSIKENYILLTNIKLSLAYIKILHDLYEVNNESIVDDELDKKINDLQTKAVQLFGKMCLEYLKEDIVNHFPTIYIIFAEALNNIFTRYFGYSQITKLRILKVFLECKDFIQGYLLVMKVMPSYLYEEDEKALKLEMLYEISSHPSDEVVMHYWLLRKNNT